MLDTPRTPDDDLPDDPERDVAPRRIKVAIHWSNGIVMCFDYAGNLLVELHGNYRAVRHKVMERSDPQTDFVHGDWSKAISPVLEVDW